MGALYEAFPKFQFLWDYDHTELATSSPISHIPQPPAHILNSTPIAVSGDLFM